MSTVCLLQERAFVALPEHIWMANRIADVGATSLRAEEPQQHVGIACQNKGLDCPGGEEAGRRLSGPEPTCSPRIRAFSILYQQGYADVSVLARPHGSQELRICPRINAAASERSLAAHKRLQETAGMAGPAIPVARRTLDSMPLSSCDPLAAPSARSGYGSGIAKAVVNAS